MSVHRSTRLAGLALASVGLIAAGCSRSGASPSIATPASTAPVIEPTTSAAASSSVPASFQPSANVPPSASSTAESQMAQPPAASIAVEGGDAVAGQLGSFTWQNSGSDGPWLPGSPIRIGKGEPLTLTLADPVGVANWTVSRAPAGADGSGLVGMAEGIGEPVTFEAPPPGSWSVNVNVWFAGNLGSAAWYWLINVN